MDIDVLRPYVEGVLKFADGGECLGVSAAAQAAEAVAVRASADYKKCWRVLGAGRDFDEVMPEAIALFKAVRIGNVQCVESTDDVGNERMAEIFALAAAENGGSGRLDAEGVEFEKQVIVAALEKGLELEFFEKSSGDELRDGYGLAG